MIVEFFGPPGAGKTTYAHACAAQLREFGVDVYLRLSARPGEELPKGALDSEDRRPTRLMSVARRIVHPAIELGATVVRFPRDSFGDPSTRVLARASANGRPTRLARYWQYLARLFGAWRQAERNDQITIFDQAYSQVILNLMIAQPYLNDEDILRLLKISPKSDLAIFVDAASDDISLRLAQRRNQFGWVGNVFEYSSKGTEEIGIVCNRLVSLSRQSGSRIFSVQSRDEATLKAGVEAIRDQIRLLARDEMKTP